jgi:hypothetical protein
MTANFLYWLPNLQMGAGGEPPVEVLPIGHSRRRKHIHLFPPTITAVLSWMS